MGLSKSARKRVAAFAKVQAGSSRVKYMFSQGRQRVEPTIVQLSDTPAIPVLLNRANKI